MMMEPPPETKTPYYLVTGLIIGFMLGLGIAWMLIPAETSAIAPDSLRADFQEDYLALIASAYISSGDIGRAEARLELLGDQDFETSLAALAQRTLTQGDLPDVARALGRLAEALAGNAMLQETQRPEDVPINATHSPVPSSVATATLRPTIAATPLTLPTITLLPTFTPSPTVGAAFQVRELLLDCDSGIPGPLIQVFVFDAANNPVPGVEAFVTWDGGQDFFYTGFQPDFSLGYADFEMEPGVSYTLALTEGDQPIPNLTAPECPGEDGERFWGNWMINFTQP